MLGVVNYSFLGKGDELYDARVWISDVMPEPQFGSGGDVQSDCVEE